MRTPSVSALRSLVAALVLAAALTASLAACGKRSTPVPPADVPDTYNRPYPSE